MARAESKPADRGLQLEVDELVLDYVLYMAIRALLYDRTVRDADHGRPSSTADVPLSMVNSYLPLYKSSHPGRQAPLSIRIRLMIVRFAIMFTRRLTIPVHSPQEASLEFLRQQNDDRASAYLSSPDRADLEEFETSCQALRDCAPLPPDVRERNLALTIASLGLPALTSNPEEHTSDVSLLDSLPAFMDISAFVASADGLPVTASWMEVAGEYMLQAALEQYRIRGESHDLPLRHAFAWGRASHDNMQATEEQARLNGMFHGEDGSTAAQWDDIKSIYMREFVPVPNAFLSTHLDSLAAKYPIEKFEHQILSFVQNLADFPEPPVLTQLEHGKLEGLTVEETDAFKRRCGI